MRWVHLQLTTPPSTSARLVSQPSVVHAVQQSTHVTKLALEHNVTHIKDVRLIHHRRH